MYKGGMLGKLLVSKTLSLEAAGAFGGVRLKSNDKLAWF